MSGGHLEAGKRDKIIMLGDISGGVNINDPAIVLPDNQVQDSLNAMFLKKGFKRWVGCENLTAKDACNDYLRGMWHSAEISGTQHLFVAYGGKLYEVNKTTGALTLIYTSSGSKEWWGATYWGTFYATSGNEVIKVESSTTYKVGIAAPAAGSAAAAAGAGLPDGTYKIYLGFARKVSGLNVLYSAGFATADVTLGGGNNQISITGFTNSSDAQVNNKVVWIEEPSGTIYYFYYETGNNTTTSFTISGTGAKNTSVDYDTYARNNLLPGAFEYLHVFDNRLWGTIGNTLYYSQKAASKYDLEKFPTLNQIQYPFQITGIFNVGENLYLNTANNGIICQPAGNVGSRFQHIEQKYSFAYMRTVADWNGQKIGLTNYGVMVFDGNRFSEWDLGYNIRPALNKIWGLTSANFLPCGFTYRRDNRIEYHLSFQDTSVGTSNNNRTYVLNLSQSFYQDSNNFKTPWEIVGRGFNYVAIDDTNVIYMGQSFNASSTIYKELATHTTQKGIYDDAGTYLTAATNMQLTVKYRTIIENMYVASIVEDIRSLFFMSSAANLSLVIADDLSKNISSTTPLSAYATAVWDAFIWDTDSWANESQQQYDSKTDAGVFGYTWYFLFSQLADDINFRATEFDVLVTLETKRGS